MKTIIIATKNRGKALEFVRMFQPLGYEVKTLLDFDEIEDIEETGQTFEENAIIKAKAVAERTGQVVIADDSGLVVDALNGAPGIYSARYAGLAKDDEANIDKVLEQLKEVPDEERTARFYCALAVAEPDGKTFTVNGTCEGVILRTRRGVNGFGYDPIFFVNELGKAMAELEPSEKNQISHRANALKKLEEIIQSGKFNA
ncbi:non-canonical purine NTP pyrophosphatase [Robertmurraya siralis]|uniref:dITP/XTP pyrophosphatase n=1 Tax=Robertmurraya siralis TaxID=77777 RepID=A0A920BRZ9_9BACI|nr:XTP/dITP diphosphatase [Robertmurraya siralis]PAE21760.1 non-canonical purine NTP pyrophosphatase [Bacillus sp. 7504-2]GIN60244.1 non-canonical purine NTP pyrophosphatase [Robertmurraya siralis]